MASMNYCAVCGKGHAEIADCEKYGVPICSAHCDICEYRLNKNGTFSLNSCGYNASTRALNIPFYVAAESEVAAELVQMSNWSPEEVAKRYENLKRFYYQAVSPEQKKQYRVQLAAAQKLLRGFADDEIAKTHIPNMNTEDLLEYRKELCRHIAENTGTERLQRAVRIALELVLETLKRRGVN